MAMFVSCTNVATKPTGIVVDGIEIDEVCMPNGVVYYSASYRLTPKFNKDSKVETCVSK